MGVALALGVFVGAGSDDRVAPELELKEFARAALIRIDRLESSRANSVSYLASIAPSELYRSTEPVGRVASVRIHFKIYGSRAKRNFFPGDLLRVELARIRAPSGLRNIDLFDYERYLSDRGIRAIVYPSASSAIDIVESRLSLGRALEKIRSALRERLNFDGRELASAIAQGALLGDKGLIDSELKNGLARTGLAHLVVVSGLHIGFVCAAGYFLIKLFLFALLYKTRREALESGVAMKFAALGALALSWGYGALTGLADPAMRATIMISIYLLALIFGRARAFYPSFAVAIVIILTLDPKALFEAGFQLSFVTLFFIVNFADRFFNHSRRVDRAPSILTARLFTSAPKGPPPAILEWLIGWAGVSIFAFIGSAPLVAYYFNLVSLVAIFLNFAMTPLAAVFFPFGLISAMLGVDPALDLIGRIFQGGARLALTLASEPLAAINLVAIAPSLVALIYGAILIALGEIAPARKKILLPITLTLISLFPLVWFARGKFDRGMTARFLDVGQGDASIIDWGSGALAIDGGRSYPTFDLGSQVLAKALFGLGSRSLSAIVSTHGDADHIGGLPGLYTTLNGARYYDNQALIAHSSRAARLRNLAKGDRLYRTWRAGERIIFDDGVSLELIWPTESFRADQGGAAESNDLSIVAKFHYRSISILFTGDIGSEMEAELIDSGADLEADILRVAHHGSSGSTSTRFLEAVRPKWALISAGRANRFGFPHNATLERLAASGVSVLRTDLEGEIQARSDGSKIEWRSFRHRDWGSADRLGSDR